jgi:serine/threonine-protein kinase
MAGPWRVEYELGRGGMGAVYAVVHDEIGKRAALKLLHKRLSARDALVERMLLEARVVNQVGHGNIVDIFETGALADGRPYIVMERLVGMPLSVRATTQKLLPDQVIAILRQICDALIAAHGAGVIHRDLKLDNVFLIDGPDPATPRVKLLDWGIAKVIDTDIHHTIDGQLVGTPQYLSPEQARGAAVSGKTDVYSLGVMAYELFLEELPFEAETAAEIMTMHLRVAPPMPSELWPDIPPALEHLLLAMLAKRPEQRPAMVEVARALDAIAANLRRRRATLATPAPALTPTRPLDRPRRWQYAVGAFAVAACAGMFAFVHDGDATPADATLSLQPPPPVAVDVRPVVAPPPVELRPAIATPAPAVVRVAAPVKPSAIRLDHPKRPWATAVVSTRKAPVKSPRRAVHLDPDGTLEAYR